MNLCSDKAKGREENTQILVSRRENQFSESRKTLECSLHSDFMR